MLAVRFQGEHARRLDAMIKHDFFYFCRQRTPGFWLQPCGTMLADDLGYYPTSPPTAGFVL
jgi:hypothetical protein